jgi:hypothetical protein
MLSAGRDARAIRRDQVVDVSAEFAHNEMALHQSRLQMHCVHPLAEWYRDTERIIDRKPDVEQIEAVNPEIIHEMAAGRDSAARNAAFPRNNVRNNVEGGRHRMLDARGADVIPLLP